MGGSGGCDFLFGRNLQQPYAGPEVQIHQLFGSLAVPYLQGHHLSKAGCLYGAIQEAVQGSELLYGQTDGSCISDIDISTGKAFSELGEIFLPR